MSKKTERPRQTESDEFNELDSREREIVDEHILVHGGFGESRTPDGLVFEGEARIIIRLEDGRTLNKVFDLQFDNDDLE